METRAQMDFLARCRVGEVESGDRFSYYSRDTPLTEMGTGIVGFWSTTMRPASCSATARHQGWYGVAMKLMIELDREVDGC